MKTLNQIKEEKEQKEKALKLKKEKEKKISEKEERQKFEDNFELCVKNLINEGKVYVDEDDIKVSDTGKGFKVRCDSKFIDIAKQYVKENELDSETVGTWFYIALKQS